MSTPEELQAEFFEKLKKFDLKFPVATLTRETGYSKGSVSQYVSGKKAPSEGFMRKFNELYDSDRIIYDTEDGNPEKLAVKDEGVPYKSLSDKDISVQAILTLARTNEKFADAAIIQAEKDKLQAQSQANITQSNLELTALIKRFADSALESAPVSQPMIVDLLGLIAEVASGKTWHSKDEALAALNKRLFDTKGLKKQGDILRG